MSLASAGKGGLHAQREKYESAVPSRNAAAVVWQLVTGDAAHGQYVGRHRNICEASGPSRPFYEGRVGVGRQNRGHAATFGISRHYGREKIDVDRELTLWAVAFGGTAASMPTLP